MSGEKKSDNKQDDQNPEFHKFQRLLKGTLAVPKKEADEKRKQYERERERDGPSE